MKLWKDLDDNVNNEEEEATKVVCSSRLLTSSRVARSHHHFPCPKPQVNGNDSRRPSRENRP